MVQCTNCHSDIPPDARFCAKCGAPAYPQQYQQQQYQQPPQYGPPQYPPYPYYAKEKEPVLALILSLLIPGVGQIYAGRIARGLMILILLPLAYIGVSMFLFFGVMGSSMGSGENFMLGFSAVMIVLWIVAFIIWAWQIYDAYRLATRYNEELRRTGRAPW